MMILEAELRLVNTVFVALFGLCIGSFLNVAIVRLPKELSLWGRSRCPQCKQVIRWYDNIPLLSYIFLRGSCRWCKKPISFRYWIVEFITGVFFVLLYLKFGWNFYWLKFSFLFSLLVLTSVIDIDYHSVPSGICPLGIIAGLFLGLHEGLYRGSMQVFAFYVQGMIVGAGVVYLLKLFGDEGLAIYLKWRKMDNIEGETESLGLGDVDFMAMIGAFLGWKLTVLAFFITPFIAMLYGIFAIVFKKSHLIPYVPYLSVGVIVAFIWGNQLIGMIMKGLYL